MRRLVSLAVGAGLVALSAVVKAAPECPTGRPESAAERGEISLEGMVGSGVNSRYGLGVGARLGHTTDSGLYLGVSATRYETDRSASTSPTDRSASTSPTDRSASTSLPDRSASTLLLGGDIGLQLGRSVDFEVRPYAFFGASMSRSGELAHTPNVTQFAVQPGLLLAPHFGPFYLTGEGRFQLLPGPAAVSLLGGAGFTF